MPMDHFRETEVGSQQVISSPLRSTEGATARAVCDEHGREARTIYKARVPGGVLLEVAINRPPS